MIWELALKLALGMKRIYSIMILSIGWLDDCGCCWVPTDTIALLGTHVPRILTVDYTFKMAITYLCRLAVHIVGCQGTRGATGSWCYVRRCSWRTRVHWIQTPRDRRPSTPRRPPPLYSHISAYRDMDASTACTLQSPTNSIRRAVNHTDLLTFKPLHAMHDYNHDNRVQPFFLTF